MALINKLTAIADAIRSQTGETGKLSLDAMAGAISNLDTGSLNFEVVGGRYAPGSVIDTVWYDPQAATNNDGYVKVSDLLPAIEDFANGCTLYHENGQITYIAPENIIETSYDISAVDDIRFVIILDSRSQFFSHSDNQEPGIYLEIESNLVAGIQIPGYSFGIASGIPTENMIWVNTDVDISSWIFGATQPEAPSDGMVWITTGKSSTAPFNALKKNNITVYPISAKQYVSRAWVDKTAKIYQGSAWVNWWDGQLYENGNQFTSVTGGWDIHDYVTNSRPLMAAEHKADQMFFQAQNNYDVLMGIDKPVDLSNVNQIRITGKINKVFPYNGAVYGITMKVLKTKDLASKVAEFSMLVEGMFDYTLNVSNLSGEHYLTIQAFPNANINGYITGVYLI